jgi:hypothetical protein
MESNKLDFIKNVQTKLLPFEQERRERLAKSFVVEMILFVALYLT